MTQCLLLWNHLHYQYIIFYIDILTRHHLSMWSLLAENIEATLNPINYGGCWRPVFSLMLKYRTFDTHPLKYLFNVYLPFIQLAEFAIQVTNYKIFRINEIYFKLLYHCFSYLDSNFELNGYNSGTICMRNTISAI